MNNSLILGECKELEHFCWKDIRDNLSYKAIDTNGNCVGVSLNAIGRVAAEELGEDSSAQPDDQDDHQIYQKHEKFYRIIKLTEALEAKVNLPGRFPELRDYVDAKVICVDAKYRGLNIAGQLVTRIFEEMIIRGLPLISIQCSSYYSARVMIKLGFQLIATIPYKDFLINGEQAIKPKSPHTEISGFIKWVTNPEKKK